MGRLVGERSDSERLPRLHQRFDGATGWGIRRRGQLERSWRSAISEEEKEAANPDQHRERRAREEAETACTYCELALEDVAEGSGDNHRVSVPCPHGGFVHVSCMLERAIASREGIWTRGPASRVAASGQGEDDPLTRRSLLEACQGLSLGEGGRR